MRGLLLALILGLCLPLMGQSLPALPGTVTRVLDGDTADGQLASGPIRVRFNGIDTPEKNQPWGHEATEALSRMIAGKHVQLEPFEQDKYERMIANVILDNLGVNAEMVRQGHAWAYRKYMKRENAVLCTLEDAARKARRGLWSLPKHDWIAPWDWRHLKTRADPIDYSHETVADCVAAIGKR
jgi:endonuclease YncB( thermonuclease family)